mgnify:CR=1 FL=1|tara:strand:+ start:1711 stop:1971 length:261 start_codon:yes stop_codon:yes gene_type:complete
MSNSHSGLTPQQQEAILSAVLELAEGETSMILEDVKRLYFMALEHYLMNDQEIREGKTCTFLHLHDFIAKVDMIYHNRENCHLLAV